MNTNLALKIEKALGLEDGFLMVLQVYHDIAKQKKKQHTNMPDLSKFRPALFWDTDFHSISWEKNQRAIIQRVFERGNDKERNEVIRFYGQDQVNEIIASKHD